MAIPTAEEFLKPFIKDVTNTQLELMRAFAELHRKEALKQASEKARKQYVPGPGGGYYIVNKDSILNAYSKKNIR